MPRLAAALRPAFAAPLTLPSNGLRLLHATPSRDASLSLRHQAPKTKNVKRPRALVAEPGTPEPRRIAVVGAGLAGLAVAYHLTHSTARYARKRGFSADDLRVTVLDPYAPGTAGASAAAAGLLHDFSPRPKRKAWQAAKGFESAIRLLEAVNAPVHAMSGLLRVARGTRDEEDFVIAARRFPRELEHLSASQLADRYPHLCVDLASPAHRKPPRTARHRELEAALDEAVQAGGTRELPSVLLYRRARVVDTPAYLRALWRTVESTGRAAFRSVRVSDVHALYDAPLSGATADPAFDGPFDTVVLAAGAALPLINGLPDLPQTVSRGTNLVLSSAAHTPPNVPLIGTGYAVPDLLSAHEPGSAARLLVGTTRENMPDACAAAPARRAPTDCDTATMRDTVHALVPRVLDEWRVESALVGDRAVPGRTKRGSVPIACRLGNAPEGKSAWLFSGLAGRGLLYHAFLGRVIAHAVVAGNERLIPLEARRFDLALQPRDDGREAPVPPQAASAHA